MLILKTFCQSYVRSMISFSRNTIQLVFAVTYFEAIYGTNHDFGRWWSEKINCPLDEWEGPIASHQAFLFHLESYLPRWTKGFRFHSNGQRFDRCSTPRNKGGLSLLSENVRDSRYSQASGLSKVCRYTDDTVLHSSLMKELGQARWNDSSIVTGTDNYGKTGWYTISIRV